MLPPIFPRWGFPLFVASLAIGCFGAALELSLDMSYILAQGLGWNWGENLRPRDDARFSMVYTIGLCAAAVPIVCGVEPLRLTLFSMAVTVMVLPLVVCPLLVIMNDRRYLKQHTNGLLTNIAAVLITVLGALLAVTAIPLQLSGS
jgi:Mn2+/Fe2+ NRAMP family transporter